MTLTIYFFKAQKIPKDREGRGNGQHWVIILTVNYLSLITYTATMCIVWFNIEYIKMMYVQYLTVQSLHGCSTNFNFYIAYTIVYFIL